MTTKHNHASLTSQHYPSASQTTSHNSKQTLQQQYTLTSDLSSLDLLRKIQNQIFTEASEAWEVLNHQSAIRVDGKTYQEIEKFTQLREQLEKVRANAPAYQNLSTRKKKSFFLALGAQYKLKLKNSLVDNEFVKSSESISQTLEVSQPESFNTKKYSKKIFKKAKMHLSHQKQQISSPEEELASPKYISKPKKKVCFTNESAFKYFSKCDPSEVIAAEVQLISSTFQKK